MCIRDRDYLDQKRLMITVAMALGPAALMSIWNTGYQANLAIATQGAAPRDDFQTGIYAAMGLAHDPNDLLACFILGLCYFVPIFIVVHAVGGIWELLFALVRGHEINEGFLVTGALFPLILPATIPLWQVALGITSGLSSERRSSAGSA